MFRSPEHGIAVASMAPPAMRPLHQTRAMPDVLLDVSRRLAKPLNPPFPWKTYEEMLKDSFEAISPAADTWKNAQRMAASGTPRARSRKPGTDRDSSASFPSSIEPQFDGEAQQFPFHFLPYESQAFLDGSLAHLPWLQELPDVLSTAMWSSWVEINPKTATGLGLAAGRCRRDLFESGKDSGSRLLIRPASRRT